MNSDKKSIGIITYNHEHLKTEQVVSNISTQKYEITLYLLPFVERKERVSLIKHRPDQTLGLHPIDLAKKLNLDYVECLDDTEIPNSHDFFVITGAGILSELCVKGKRIINCHPGLIPTVRGLDAFKWAIYNGWPLGNTLHFIDTNVDFGTVIARINTPVKINDTIFSLAKRHYETEIAMLSNFDKYVFSDKPIDCLQNPMVNEANRRMPIEIEQIMIQRFEEYKKRFSE